MGSTQVITPLRSPAPNGTFTTLPNKTIMNKLTFSNLFKCIVQSFQLENLRERIEEESEKKSDALKALSKAQAEIQLWKSKFETEGLGRIDDLESSKQKLSARLGEAEETVENMNQKVASTEKTKHRLESELEELQLEYERVHAAAVITEKRGRNFDKVCPTYTFPIDNSQVYLRTKA